MTESREQNPALLLYQGESRATISESIRFSVGILEKKQEVGKRSLAFKNRNKTLQPTK